MELITLDATPLSDLKWEHPSQKGVFFLDFGWGSFDPFDEGKFHAYQLAVEEFSKSFPEAKEVVLAKTNGYFSSFFPHVSEYEAAMLFSNYLHNLASFLPDGILPILYCDLSKEIKTEDLILSFCKRRFAHIQLVFIGKTIPIDGQTPIIVVLPQDEKYDPSTYAVLFNALQGHRYKCIPEELLNDHWDGVDVVIVEENSLSELGKRMLLGFEAAGGQILFFTSEKLRAKSFDLTLSE